MANNKLKALENLKVLLELAAENSEAEAVLDSAITKVIVLLKNYIKRKNPSVKSKILEALKDMKVLALDLSSFETLDQINQLNTLLAIDLETS